MIKFRWDETIKREFSDVWMLIFILLYLFSLASIIVLTFLTYLCGIIWVNKWIYKISAWILANTKIGHMQSIFQLGTATSIAFAIAGPQIQHALGPRAQGALRHVRHAISKSHTEVSELRKLLVALQNFNNYKREYGGLGRGNLYPLHYLMAIINFALLFWSSLIDPGGGIPNGIAFLIITASMFVPFVDLNDAFFAARHIRPMLQEAKTACDSGDPGRIDAICAKFQNETKPLPPNM